MKPRTPDTRDLERTLLGGFLMQSSLLQTVRLEPADFSIPAHREIYAVLCDLAEKGPIDLTIFLDAAETRGRTDAWGGASSLIQLPGACVSVVLVPTYAEKLREHRKRRDVELALRRALEDLPPAGDESFATRLAATVKNLTEIGGQGRGETASEARAALQASRVGTFMGAALDRMAARADQREHPIPLPWSSVSDALGGGLWPGLYVLVGNTGCGKSQWALQAAVEAARRGTPVLYIGLELGRVDLVARLLGLLTARRWSRLFLGNGENARGEIATVRESDAARELAELPFHLELGAPMGWSYPELLTRARAMRELYPEPDGPGSRPFLVVLDFLQIVSSPADAREEQRERIGRAAYTARAVARELDAAVLLVSSTARDNYAVMEGAKDGKKSPGLGEGSPTRLVGMGKESGEVEYAADAVLVLAREAWEAGKPPPPTWLAVAKGRAVVPGWVELSFDGGRFTEPGTRRAAADL